MTKTNKYPTASNSEIIVIFKSVALITWSTLLFLSSSYGYIIETFLISLAGVLASYFIMNKRSDRPKKKHDGTSDRSPERYLSIFF